MPRNIVKRFSVRLAKRRLGEITFIYVMSHSVTQNVQKSRVYTFSSLPFYVFIFVLTSASQLGYMCADGVDTTRIKLNQAFDYKYKQQTHGTP
jgi:hypothetical protein